MKRTFSMILAIIMIFSISVNASAAEVVYDDVLTYPSARSLTPPSERFDLSNAAYQAHIFELGSKWLYTNFFFQPGSKGSLNVSFTMTSAPGYTFYVGCYDIQTNSLTTKRTFPMKDGYGCSGSCTFSGLNSAKGYAIAFMVEGNGTYPFADISGTAMVTAS